MPDLSAATVIDRELLRRVTTACDLESLRSGPHGRRDERGWIMRDAGGRKVGEATVRSLWITEIWPAFMPPACLAVLTLEKPDRRLGVFAHKTYSQGAEHPPSTLSAEPPTLLTAGPLEVPDDWDDPVVSTLRRLDCWSSEPRLYLDGRGYTLYADTWDARMALMFSNPHTPAFRSLEQAFLSVAGMLAARDDTGSIDDYVQHWARYVVG